MQNASSHKIVVTLDSATNRRSHGPKAAGIARLLRKGFAVPNGFCLSAEAYRAHLWSAGARELARGTPDATQRQAIRQAIMETSLSADVLSALETAYAPLGDSVLLAVRHSASDDDAVGKAYAAVLGVRGFAALIDAVKQVWASLWSDEVALLRDAMPRHTEPTMAVVIQRMVDARASGAAVTANPETGNPNEIVISCSWGVGPATGRTDRAIVDLLDFCITDASIARKETHRRLTSDGLETVSTPQELIETPSLGPAGIVEVAAAAARVEGAIAASQAPAAPSPGCGPSGHGTLERQVVRWAHDGERLWILGVRPVARLPAYFPLSWDRRKDGLLLRRLCSPAPISFLMQSLPIYNRSSVPSLRSAGHKMGVRCQGGRMYRGPVDPSENRGRLAALFDVISGAGLYRRWRSTADRIVRESRRDLSRPMSKLSSRALASSIRLALRRAALSAQWYEAAAYPPARFVHLLREMLDSTNAGPGLAEKLLSGLDEAGYRTHADLQRLSAYVWQAETLAEEEDTMAADMAAGLAMRLGYAFWDSRDALDASGWRSWVEDPDRILQVARSLARGPRVDVSLARQRARAGAQEAERSALAALRSSRSVLKRPFARVKFRMLLGHARVWLAAGSERSEVHALALASLRCVLMELARRLAESGGLQATDDIFFLKRQEIERLRTGGKGRPFAWLRRLIAQRKHEMWLQSRLCAPEWLPIGAHPHPAPLQDAKSRGVSGTPASPGEATGAARVVSSPKQALEVQPGEVLVVEELPPALTPLLGLAAGLVISDPDTCSPGAIAARDYAIPCVVGVAGATRLLRTGQTIHVDGTIGVIRVASQVAK